MATTSSESGFIEFTGDFMHQEPGSLAAECFGGSRPWALQKNWISMAADTAEKEKVGVKEHRFLVEKTIL